MPQSHSKIIVHVIFSTSERYPFLVEHFRTELHMYMSGILNNLSGKAIEVGSIEDHIHILLSMPRDKSVADIVRTLKVSTTKWIKQNKFVGREFAWQSGYAAFSVSAMDYVRVVRYIRNQRQHHGTISFHEEFESMLSSVGIDTNDS